MALSRYDNAILNQIDTLQAQGDWDAAIAAIDEALNAGMERSIHGLPLDFVRRDIESRRCHLANRAAVALLDDAALVLQDGNLNEVHLLYAKANNLPNIDADTKNLVQAHIELLETRAPTYAHNQASLASQSSQIDEQTIGLLQTIDLKQPNMARLLQLCAAPRWLDASIIQVLRGKDDGRGAEILERLAPYSFVYAWDTGRYSLSDETRHFYLARWALDPHGYRALNTDLAHHFSQRLASNPPRNPAHYQQLVQAQLYHTFLSDPDEGTKLLVQAFQKAEDEYQRVAARQYIIVLQELKGQIPPEYYAYIVYGEGWFHHIDGNRHAARLIFEELASRTDLTPDLMARVWRGLGAVQARDGQWIEAFASYQRALDAFETEGAGEEVAKSMVGMGNTHLNMALSAAGIPAPFASGEASSRGLLSIGAFLVRLPLTIYLLWKLDTYLWPLPNLLKLGQGMDWAIARLYSDAILWLRRAETIFVQEENASGLHRVRENLGRIYLALSHPHSAVEVLAPLIKELEPGSLPQARAQLGYADALALLGRLDEATELWQETLQIFTALGHKQSLAQVQSRLGYSATQRNDSEGAVDAYDAAFSAWQELDEPERATVTLDAMEDAIATSAVSELTQQKVSHAQSQLSVRTYPVRYLNQRLGQFQRISIYLFAVLFGLVLLVGLEIQPQVDLDTAVIFSAIENPFEVDALSLTSQIMQDVGVTVRPKFPVLVALSVGIAALYLALYTLIGLWLLYYTPLSQIQQVQRFKLRIEPSGLTKVSLNHEYRVDWDSITQIVRSKRAICTALIDLLSNTLVQSDETSLEIDGLTRQFTRIEQTVKRRVNDQARIIDISVSFLCGGLGFIFLGSLLLQGLFVFVATNEFSKDILLISPVRLQSYALIDFYNLIDLGVALPLLYWLVLQPIRYRLHRRPSPVYLVILVFLAGVSCIIAFAPLYLERPSIMPSAAAIVLSLSALLNYWRFFRHKKQKRGRDAEVQTGRARSAMYTLMLVATVAILFMSTARLMREALGFHYFVQGNSSLVEAEKRAKEERALLTEARIQLDEISEEFEQTENTYSEAVGTAESGEAVIDDKAGQAESLDLTQMLRDTQEKESAQREAEQNYQAAEEAYQATLLDLYGAVIGHYEESLQFKQDPDVHTRIGVVSSKIGLHDQALVAYAEAAKVHKRGLGARGLPYKDLDIQFHTAGAITVAATDAVDEDRKIEYYIRAVDEYDAFLENVRLQEANTKNYRDAHELRAGALFNLFFLEANDPDRRQRLEDALSTYVELGEDSSVARGWTYLYLSREADDEAVQQQYLEAAIDSFKDAVENDNPSFAAYNGRAWSHIEMGKLLSGECLGDIAGHGAVSEYDPGQLQLALAAFANAIESADEAHGFAHRMRAELHYILSACGEQYGEAAELQLAIDDYELAVATEHADKSQWLFRLGNLYQEMAAEEIHEATADHMNSQAADAYLGAIAADTDFEAAYDSLRDVNEKLGVSEAQTLDDILSATEMVDSDEDLIALARGELERNTFVVARTAMERVLARNPTNGEAAKLLAETMFAWARLYDTDNRIARYREAIDAATKAILNNVDDAETYAILGRSHMELGNNEVAISLLELAHARDATDPKIQFDLAMAHLRIGNTAMARQEYRSAIKNVEITGTGADQQYLLANALGDLLVEPPDSLQTNFALASMLIDVILADSKTEFSDAQEYYRAGQLVANHRNRAQEESNVRAVSLLSRAVALDPLKEAYWTPLRNALILGLGMGQIESGEATLAIILGASGDQEVEELLHVAKTELAQNRFGLAVAALERALTREPDNEEIYTLLAQAYYRWSYRYRDNQRIVDLHSQQAVDTFARASERGITNADLYLYQSGGLFGLGDYEESLAALKRATRLDATDAQVLWLFGWWAYEAEQYEHSVIASGRATELPPNDPRQFFNQALAYVALGETGNARQRYLAGIEAANHLDNAAIRLRRLQEGINDLKDAQADPAESTPEFIMLLEQEMARETP